MRVIGNCMFGSGTILEVSTLTNGGKHGVGALTSVWTILDIFLS